MEHDALPFKAGDDRLRSQSARPQSTEQPSADRLADTCWLDDESPSPTRHGLAPSGHRIPHTAARGGPDEPSHDDKTGMAEQQDAPALIAGVTISGAATSGAASAGVTVSEAAISAATSTGATIM